MFDWQAKITRLLELPGLTDEQRKEINDASPFLRWVSAPDGGRNLQQPMRHALERLIEARGMSWSVRFKSQAALEEFQGPKDSCRASLGPVGLSLWVDGYGPTPAQALCDAILAALEEAPHD